MDDVFADSGFNDRQQTKKIKVSVTQPDGTTKEVEKEVVDDWCGMFAAANMFRGAALDKDLRMAFAHTDNVNDFFQYTAKVNASRAPLSVWADGQWWSVKEYHASRSAPAQVGRRPVGGGRHPPRRHRLDPPRGRQAAARDREPHRHGRVLRPGHRQARLDRGQRHRGRSARTATGRPQRTGDGKLKSSSQSPTSTVVEVRDMKDEKDAHAGRGSRAAPTRSAATAPSTRSAGRHSWTSRTTSTPRNSSTSGSAACRRRRSARTRRPRSR